MDEPRDVHNDTYTCAAPGPAPQPTVETTRPDGSEPLAHPGHEATARFMATPKHESEFKTIKQLAKSCDVTPKTIHLWAKDRNVRRRAAFLTEQNRLLGDIIGKVAWPAIMQKMCQKARAGDVAARFVAGYAWPEKREPRGNELSGLSIKEMFEMTIAEGQRPPSEPIRDGE